MHLWLSQSELNASLVKPKANLMQSGCPKANLMHLWSNSKANLMQSGCPKANLMHLWLSKANLMHLWLSKANLMQSGCLKRT